LHPKTKGGEKAPPEKVGGTSSIKREREGFP